MPLRDAPAPPRQDTPLVDPGSGKPSQQGYSFLHGLWRQNAAGHCMVPCLASTSVANLITLRPKMHEEGASAYGDYMTFIFVADASSTGPVTAKLVSTTRSLSTLKVYISGGATQADVNDVLITRLYFLTYNSALDAAAGGFVLK